MKRCFLLLLFTVAVAGGVGATGLGKQWKARHHQRQAMVALTHFDYELARKHIQTARQAEPRSSELALLHARVARRLGRYDEVAAALQLIRDDPTVPKAKWQREQILAMARSGRVDDVEPHLSEMLKSAGDLKSTEDSGADICEAFATGYVRALRFRKAFGVLDAWEREYPRDPQARFLRAAAHNSLFHFEEARQAYEAGFDRNPDRVDMRLEYARMLFDNREYKDAADQLGLALRQEPENRETRFLLSRVFFRQGRTELAARLVEDLLADEDDNADMLLLAGQLAVLKGDKLRAVSLLARAAELQSYDSEIRYALGRALLAVGRKDEAQPHLDYVKEAEQPLNRMERQMTQAMQEPDNAEIRYEIGATLFKYGSPAEAARWLNSVVQLQPGHREAHRLLAEYFEQQGDVARARQHRNAAQSTSDP